LFHLRNLDTTSKVAVGKNITTGEEGVQLVVNSLKELLILERGILNESADANDERLNCRTGKNNLGAECLVELKSRKFKVKKNTRINSSTTKQIKDVC